MHREEVPSADLGFSQLLLSFCQMSAAAAKPGSASRATTEYHCKSARVFFSLLSLKI